MINRVLIRIKVVQLLYSYLLVETPFTLLSQPSGPTKEKRFAYSLYLDTLLLMLKIAQSVSKRGGEQPLFDTRFISRVSADDRMKSLRNKYAVADFPLEGLVAPLASAVKESAIYKNFLKKRDDAGVEDRVWTEIFEHIIFNNPEYQATVSRREGYSLRGVDRMRDMVRETFTDFFASADHLPDALKELGRSLLKARELYIRLLALAVEITDLRSRRIDDARHKFLKSEEDINPNLRLVENEFVQTLYRDPEFQKELKEFPSTWMSEDPTLVNALLRDIMESDIYRQYMEFPATDFNADCEFWREIYKNVIFRNPNLLEHLEDTSVFWNDDVDVIGTFVLKTVRRYQEGNEAPILPMYKDEEDARFGSELFSAVVRRKDAYRNMIDDALAGSGWEFERLAFMDVVIVMTALAEILNFPKIPVNVSLNEYIEMAKAYSSRKSGAFVNGLLGSLLERLRADGQLQK